MTWLDEFYALNPDIVEDALVEAKKEHKLDLFKMVLPALDRRDKMFYNNVTDDERKDLNKQIWILTRWMSSTKNHSEHHLLMVNDIVNMNSSDLKNHPELQWKLLALCGSGKTQMHQWIAPPRGAKKNKIEAAILKIFPLLKDDDLELLLSINTTATLSEFFKENGLSDKEVNELIT